MNTSELPPTLRATAAVARSIIAVASGLIGVAAVAYLIGLKETLAYYGTFGAPWITSLLSPTRLAQSSAWVIWITLAFAFSSVYSIATTDATHHGIRRWAIITLSIGLTLGAIDVVQLDSVPLQVKALLLALAAILFAVSAGLTIAEVIARFKDDGFRWHSYHMWLFYFVILLTFHWAPARMGEAQARLDLLEGSTSLPLVNSKDAKDEREWRLLEVLDGNAILVIIGTTSDQNEFRVVQLHELENVRSARKPPK